MPGTTQAATVETQPIIENVAELQQTAAQAELSRVMGILNCDEAQGRESLAKALAAMPGMSVEAAKVALLAAPKSAQVRTDTALDALMKDESPNAVSTAAGKKTGAEAKTEGLLKAAKALTGAE